MAVGRSTRRVFVLLLLLLTLASLPLSAQTVTGTLSGTVSDSSGGALPGVTVTIRNAETGLERVVVTNEAGFFNAPFLPVGRYNVNAELSGLGNARRQTVPVNLNETTRQDIVIDPQVAESITVNAEAPRINVSDGEIKQSMRSEEIMSLPSTDQGSFLRLASAFSGYQENMSSGQDNPTLSSGSSVNFNGAGTRGTTFQINGVNNDDSSENQQRQGAALATIKSFQVLTNSFSAEFGRGYGAVVLVQTKSGTNNIAGELYAYAQDNKFNSRRKLDTTRPDRYRRQYGFTAGFPIMTDRLFGFINGDMLENKGQNQINRWVFTQADLALPRLTLGNDTPENRAWQNSIIARWPQVEPNNPARSARTHTTTQDIDFPDRDYSGRLDWNVSASNAVNARYQVSSQRRTPSDFIRGEQAEQDHKQSNFGLTWTNILSSNTVQEARYGLGVRDTNSNIGAGNDTPVVRMAGLTDAHILGNAGAFPITRDQRDQQFVYNISSARWSNHTLKLGTDIRRSQLDDRADNNHRGFWNFTATCGGVTYPTGMHAFLAGCVNTFSKSFGPNFLQNEWNETNVYAQDDWRPWENLTLNLGVRYERVTAPEERENRIDYYYGTTDYVDPRLGFAYTPEWASNRFLRALTGGQGKFSIRGGFGIYHGRVFQSVFSQGGASIRTSDPYAVALVISNSTNLADPTNGFVFVPGTPLTQRVSVLTVDPDLQMPETRQWNLTFERQVLEQARFRASYIGTLGKNLLQYRFHNLPVKPSAPGTAGATWVVAQDWRCAGTGQPGAAVNAACPVAVPIAANEVSLRFPRTNERRPDVRYTTNLEVANLVDSSYHAGQLEFETGSFRGFQGRVTYTFAKALDEGSEATASGTGDINIFPQGPEGKDYRRGPSRFDTRHRATVSGSYQFPWFKEQSGFAGALLGGWQLSTLMRWSTGTPFTIIDGAAPDIDFDGISNFRPVCVRKEYCGGWYVNHPNDSVSEMPRDAYRRAVYGDTLDDLIDRNSMYTDGLETVDLGLYKTFRLPLGGDSLVLRLDVFNVFNHVTWAWPTNDINNVNFGRILDESDSYSPRTFQVGLRYIY